MPVIVDLAAAELEGMADKLGLAQKDMERAIRVAARQTASWARTQVARGLAARLGVSPSVLAGKRLVVRAGKNSARVWVALNQINLAAVGATASSRGLRAGRKDFRGAFLATSRYGDKAALRRTGRARKPLEGAGLDVMEVAPAELQRGAWPALNERFLAFYAAELERRA